MAKLKGLTIWWKCEERETGRNVLVAFRGDRLGWKFDTDLKPEDEPTIRCKKRVADFVRKAGFSEYWTRPITCSAIAMEVLRRYVGAQWDVIPCPS